MYDVITTIYIPPAHCSSHLSNFNSTFGGCTFMLSWNAYRCQRLQHFMFVFESMDADRRLSPIALHGGNTGAGNYTDMINGPMDQWTMVSYNTSHIIHSRDLAQC